MIGCDACMAHGYTSKGTRCEIEGTQVDLCDQHFEDLQTKLGVLTSRFGRHDGKVLSDRDCRVIAEFFTPSPPSPSC